MPIFSEIHVRNQRLTHSRLMHSLFVFLALIVFSVAIETSFALAQISMQQEIATACAAPSERPNYLNLSQQCLSNANARTGSRLMDKLFGYGQRKNVSAGCSDLKQWAELCRFGKTSAPSNNQSQVAKPEPARPQEPPKQQAPPNNPLCEGDICFSKELGNPNQYPAGSAAWAAATCSTKTRSGAKTHEMATDTDCELAYLDHVVADAAFRAM